MTSLRFIDLCAGIGGFHLAIHQVVGETAECVLAAEVDPELRETYVRNFHASGLSHAYAKHHASAAQDDKFGDLFDVYGRLRRIHGDVNDLLDASGEDLRSYADGTPLVPEHDLLCAGFPCQPFSKSGSQLGFGDSRGTVFGAILTILRARRPKYILLENVGNLEAHDRGRTWETIRRSLEDVGYSLAWTSHVKSGGSGLLSPHHIGEPHHRERFFVVGQLKNSAGSISDSPFPLPIRRSDKAQVAAGMSSDRLDSILDGTGPSATTKLSHQQKACIEIWEELLSWISAHEEVRREDEASLIPLPSFPIWGWELDPFHAYPNSPPQDSTEFPPASRTELPDFFGTRDELLAEYQSLGVVLPIPARTWARPGGAHPYEFMEQAPQYARRAKWPRWKWRFVSQNRKWARGLWSALIVSRVVSPEEVRDWLERLFLLPASFQKLEWNCRFSEITLAGKVLQCRPSGLRARPYGQIPALVAMTTTQVPIVSHAGTLKGYRHLTISEGLQLQGFPRRWHLPIGESPMHDRVKAFKALGNAVHVGLVSAILQKWAIKNRKPFGEPDYGPNSSQDLDGTPSM